MATFTEALEGVLKRGEAWAYKESGDQPEGTWAIFRTWDSEAWGWRLSSHYSSDEPEYICSIPDFWLDKDWIKVSD